MLQQYYTNLQYTGNSDYAYIKLAYFDFPVQDSLVKVFPEGFMRVKFYVRYYKSDHDPTDTTLNGDSGRDIYDLQVSILNVTSPSEFADAIKRAILEQEVRTRGYNTNVAIRSLLAWLSDIYYDAASYKLCFSYGVPYNVFGVWDDGVGNSFPVRLDAFFTSWEMNEQQSRLAANLFGGRFVSMSQDTTFEAIRAGDPNKIGTWHSAFLSGNAETSFLRLHMASKNPGADTSQLLALGGNTYNVYSERPPLMVADPYVYIHGAPEASIWQPNGLSTDLLAVMPRNRQLGQQVSQTAFLSDQTHATKTSLASLRSMVLRLTDSRGNPIPLDDQYTIKLVISFDL